MRSTLFALAMLALAAVGTQWLVWLSSREGVADTFVGPPRSDYVLGDFELNVLGADGRLAFTVKAPRLAKHPQLDTLAIDAPRLRMFDAKRNEWHARANTGWVRDGMYAIVALARMGHHAEANVPVYMVDFGVVVLGCLEEEIVPAAEAV